jgi:predicted PurR-regulated permease PerM
VPEDSSQAKRGAGSLIREIGAALGHYAAGQVVIAAILSILYAVGFALAGLPLWFLLAPVCGLLNLIPYFGFLIGLFLALLVALIGGIGFERILAVTFVFVIVSALESYWLTPRILGRRLGLRPLYVFLAVLFAGVFFGFFGLLLAVPALAVATIIYRFYRAQ